MDLYQQRKLHNQNHQKYSIDCFKGLKMIEYEVFNLEEIKELISSFNDLQISYNLLNSLSDDFKTNDIRINNVSISQDNLIHFTDILNSIHSLIDNLLEITDQNINLFNEFQNNLLSKFKRNYKKKLKGLELNKHTLQHLGNSLIKNKNVFKIVSNISYVQSIRLSQWFELIDSLKQNSTFNIIIQKLNKFYQDLIEHKLNEQLSKIQGKFDESFINDYKRAFYEDPKLTISEYQHLYENSLNKEEFEEKKDYIEKEQKKLELEKLKKNQEKQDELFQDYLRLPSKEFERRRRKEQREKLSKIDLESTNDKKIEISKEASEKIEKFKSSLDKSLENNYLFKENEDKSPIELIRERKKRKSEEFRKYKKHFEAE